MLQPFTIKFLKELQKNNNKEWFEFHRKNYEAAKEDFSQFITKIISAYAKSDADIASLNAKDCMFRINRDIRFSKNKTPYKTNLAASINRGGKKSFFAGYYFHCEPDAKSFVAGGIWMPEADKIKKIRQEIDYNWQEFEKIIMDKKFKTGFGDLENGKETKLTREPKGYDKNNDAIEYIKLKSWVASKPIADNELTDKNCIMKIITAFETLKPMIHFLNHALED
jgi:uncharacterized protein (TIGR02453 family)